MRNWLRKIFASSNIKSKDIPKILPVAGDTTQLLQRGGLAFQQGNFAIAAECCRSILDIAPDNVEALRMLGFALRELGALHEAKAMLRRSLKFEAYRADTYYFLGEIAAAQGNVDAACSNWRTAIRVAPDFEPAYLGLCGLLFQDGWLDIALQVVQDGIQHIPRSAEMYFCQGKLHHGKQQFNLAEQAYREAMRLDPNRADILVNLGSTLAAQNQYEKAIEFLERSIDLEPNHAYLRNRLANMLCKVNRFDEALLSFRSAIAMDPAYAEGWNDLGITLHELDRSAEAVECFEGYLREDPVHVPTLCNLANVLHNMQRWDEATQYYLRILELAPDRVDVLCNLGATLAAAGDNGAAEASYRRALALKPDDVDANFNQGLLLHTLGKFDEAAYFYLNSIATHPNHIPTRFNLASLYRTQGKWLEAGSQYQHILRIQPDHVHALCDWGMTFQSRELHDEAIMRYQEALAIDPASHNALLNLGTALEETGKLGAARESYENVLRINPDSIEARINMASIFAQQGRIAESIDMCDQVLQIDPDHADAHYSRGLSLLRAGQYESGWKEYEYRWTRTDAPPRPDFPAEEWRGDKDLQGKTILLYTEQGLGDTIQFVRYVQLVAAMGAKIILEVQAPLLPLFKQLKGIGQFLVRGQTEELPAFDVQCSLLSLPAAFNSAMATIPAHCPYLQAPSERVAYWRERLAQSNPKIGLVWSGNPLHKNDRNRSMSLSTLVPLWQENWTFLSLQKDVRPEDAALLHDTTAIFDLSTYLTDFAETAAIISCLDLVITIDSSLAHLSGALGIPVWIMLPYLPDFRWLMERQDSPWYSSARLFRQSRAGDWTPVVQAIIAALAARFGSTQAVAGTAQ